MSEVATVVRARMNECLKWVRGQKGASAKVAVEMTRLTGRIVMRQQVQQWAGLAGKPMVDPRFANAMALIQAVENVRATWPAKV